METKRDKINEMKAGLLMALREEGAENFALRKMRMACEEIKRLHPEMDDKEIGKLAKVMVMGLMKAIAYA